MEIVELSANQSFWSVLHSQPLQDNSPVQNYLLMGFYGSLSPELLGLFMNLEGEEPYTRSLIYVDTPFMNPDEGEYTVARLDHLSSRDYLYINPTPLTGGLAHFQTVHDFWLEALQISLVICIVGAGVVLSIRWKKTEKEGEAMSIQLDKASMLTAWFPLWLVLGLSPLVFLFCGIKLNLYTVATPALAMGFGITLIYPMAKELNTGELTFQAVDKAFVRNGIAPIENTAILIFVFMSFLLVPASGIYNAIMVLQLMVIFMAVATLFLLPSVALLMAKDRDQLPAYLEDLERKEQMEKLSRAKEASVHTDEPEAAAHQPEPTLEERIKLK